MVLPRPSSFFLGVWGAVLLLQVACTATRAEPTFEAMSAEIEAPIENCPNISGTYEFTGTPLPGMPSNWPGLAKVGSKVGFDYFILLRPIYNDKQVKNREDISEVEITQDHQTIHVYFKGSFGQKTVVLPERPDDQLGCGKDAITLAGVRGINLSEGGGSGYNVFKHTVVKNVDGSLDMTVQLVGHYRTLIFPWTHEERNGARFAPKR